MEPTMSTAELFITAIKNNCPIVVTRGFNEELGKDWVNFSIPYSPTMNVDGKIDVKTVDIMMYDEDIQHIIDQVY
jgi:hypothetical protein